MTRTVVRASIVVVTLFAVFGCEGDSDSSSSSSFNGGELDPDHPVFQLPTRSAADMEPMDSEPDASSDAGTEPNAPASDCSLGEACETFYLRACACCSSDRVAPCGDRVQSACITGQLEIDLTANSCAQNNAFWDELEQSGQDVCLALSDGDVATLCEPSGTIRADPSNNCCSAHTSPGCGDANCETIVCSYDDYCCQGTWSDECAQAAGLVCAICGADN